MIVKLWTITGMLFVAIGLMVYGVVTWNMADITLGLAMLAVARVWTLEIRAEGTVPKLSEVS